MEEEQISLLEHELGAIKTNEEKCPGVYHISTLTGSDCLGTEFYVVTPDAYMISSTARAYGRIVGNNSGLLLYSLDLPAGGRRIIDYEINRYRVKCGLPLPEGMTLYDIALYAMKDNPEYFGEYPVPLLTPWGRTTRHKRVGNGIYYLETDHAADTLAVCYPYTLGFSSAVMRCARYTDYDKKQGIDNTLGYTFFAREDICLPVFELMSTHSECREKVDEAALMNAIWLHHPEYAINLNLWEQTGLRDYLNHLTADVKAEAEPGSAQDHLIRLSSEAGVNFLKFTE